MNDNNAGIRMVAATQATQILAGSGSDLVRFLTLAWGIETFITHGRVLPAGTATEAGKVVQLHPEDKPA